MGENELQEQPLFKSHTLRWIVLATLAVAPAVVIFPQAFRPLQSQLTYAMGRAKGCSYEQAAHPLDQRVDEIGWKIWRQMKVDLEESGLVRWRTPMGEIWAPSQTSVAFLLAEQEAGVYDGGLVRIEAGDVVLDCGANIGAFSKRALASGAKIVVAIEPSPSNVECLRRNFRNEIEAGRLILVSRAVWHERSTLRFTIHENSALDTAVLNNRYENRFGTKEVQVAAVPLDEIVSELALDRVDFIKMDVEGAERNALLGASETLVRYRPKLAVATENRLNDIEEIPKTVLRIQPSYRTEIGPCTQMGEWRMRPEVVYFR